MAARREAIHESARALALDPSLPDGAEIIGRLLLEVPPTVPAEVETELARAAGHWLSSFANGVAWSFLAYLILVPSLIGGGWEVMVPLGAIVGGSMAIVARAKRGHFVAPWILAVVGASQILILSLLYSPLVACALAVLLSMQLALNPFATKRDSFVLAILGAAALVAPMAAGSVGWMQMPIELRADGVLFHVYGIDSALHLFSFLVLGMCTLVGVAVQIGSNLRIQQLTSTRLLHLQQWSLRHLIPQTSNPLTAAASR